jgi:aryl-alcohol dehydrogenase-like predicted oxidoreductase
MTSALTETTLGAGGPPVTELSLGTMALAGASQAEADAVVARAIDAGIRLVDTADVYGLGRVEELLGGALAGRRDDVVLATKLGLPMGDDPARRGSSPAWIRQAVQDSLRRLRTDHIDLYQLHRPDPAVPIADTLGALQELIDAGTVRWTGTSVFPAEQLVEAQWAAQRNGYAAPVSEQPPYSVLVRSIERAALPTAARHGVGVLVWGPLNGGWLTGKYQRGVAAPQGSRAASGNPFVRADDEAKLTASEKLAAIAADAGRSLTGLALAWALEHPAVTSVIIGPRTLDQLEELLAVDRSPLDTATLDAIDEVVAPGTDVDPRNSGWTPPELAAPLRRARGRGDQRLTS